MSVSETSDRALIARIRRGDDEAVALLWRRHHKPVTKLAAVVSSPSMADDLTSEAFERTMLALRRGSGPEELMRPYLYTVVRNLASREHRRGQRFADAVELDSIDEATIENDPAAMFATRLGESLLGRAFRALPERWQTVLWYVDVERLPPRRVAPLLGLSPHATSALAYRARRSLRAAWMQAHLELEGRPDDCRRALAVFGAVEEGTASARDRRSFEDHVSTCPWCPPLVEEVRSVARVLPALLLLIGGLSATAAVGWGARPVPEAKTVPGERRTTPGRSLVVAASIVALVGAGAGAGVAVTASFGSSASSVVDGGVTTEGANPTDVPPVILDDASIPENVVGPATDPEDTVVIAEPDQPLPVPSPAAPEPSAPVAPLAPQQDGQSTVESSSEEASPSDASETEAALAPEAPTLNDEWDPAATVAPLIEGRAAPGARVRIWPEGRPEAAVETEVPASGAWSMRIEDLRPTDAAVAAVAIDPQGRRSPTVSSAPFAFVPLVEAPTEGTASGVDPVALRVRGWASSRLVVRLDGRELARGLEIPASGVLDRRIGRSTASGLIGLAPGIHELEVAYQRLDASAAGTTRVTFTVSPVG